MHQEIYTAKHTNTSQLGEITKTLNYKKKFDYYSTSFSERRPYLYTWFMIAHLTHTMWYNSHIEEDNRVNKIQKIIIDWKN